MNPLVYVDTESTGLDPIAHDIWEAAWWPEDDPEPSVAIVPHSSFGADPVALRINRYWERRTAEGWDSRGDLTSIERLTSALTGATVVGANPAFDTGMLRKLTGPVWYHRLIDLEAVALTIFDWDRPRSFADVCAALNDEGFEIPTPDHTARGDVIATRAAHRALRILRGRMTGL